MNLQRKLVNVSTSADDERDWLDDVIRVVALIIVWRHAGKTTSELTVTQVWYWTNGRHLPEPTELSHVARSTQKNVDSQQIFTKWTCSIPSKCRKRSLFARF